LRLRNCRLDPSVQRLFSYRREVGFCRGLPILTDLRSVPLPLRRQFIFVFLLTLTRAIALPYTVIFLARVFALNVQTIGLLMGSALIVGIIASLSAGQLIDRLGAGRVLVLMVGIFSLGHILIGIGGPLPWIYFLLIAVNAAYSATSVATRTALGDFEVDKVEREKLFSIRYTLINVGFGIGPFIGSALAGIGPHTMFLWAGFTATISSLFLFGQNKPNKIPNSSKDNKISPWHHMGATVADRRVIYFTLGGLFCSLAMRQFPSYLSQYLLKIKAENIYQIINYVSSTNALTVILLQYIVTRRLVSFPIYARLSAGVFCLGGGIIGFMLAGRIEVWILAMFIFSFGEIIISTGEFAAIDRIAPEHLRGSYYAVQNLSTLGGGITPVLCGLVLATLPPQGMFLILLGAVFLAFIFYTIGIRHKSN